MKTSLIYGILFFIIFVAGCASQKTAQLQTSIWENTSSLLEDIQGTARNLSLPEIRETLISNSAKLETFRAQVKLSLTTPDTNGPVRCSGVILYQSPKNFRAMGSKLTATVFDMTSDGDVFQIHVPQENKMYTGKCDSFRNIEALDIKIFPGDLASLFNSSEILKGDRTALEVWPAHWLIHMLEAGEKDMSLKGNLFVDRINGEAFKYELFNSDDSVRLQAVFTNYALYKECRLPQKIDVRWPQYKTELSISFSNITVNEELNPKVFQLTMPKNVKTIYLD